MLDLFWGATAQQVSGCEVLQQEMQQECQEPGKQIED
jgi:hypothetical protein